MNKGLCASQAGHAFIASFAKSPPEISKAFIAHGGGTNVVLACPDEATLWQTYNRAVTAGITCHMWLESEPVAEWGATHAVPVALGIGPVERGVAKPVVRELKLLKE